MILILSYLFGINGLASAQAVADVLSLGLSVPLAIKARKLITEKEQASGSASCVHSDLSEAAGV